MTVLTPQQLIVTPRAAKLTIVADPTLGESYRATWEGATPRVREQAEVLEVDYTLAGRVHALAPVRGSLTLALHPAVEWAIELRRGVAGLRADLRELRLASLLISGGAADIVVDLPEPSGELELRVEGGLARGIVRRPAAVPVSVQIDGGATHLRIDDARLGAVGGVVRQRTAGAGDGGGEIAVRVLGGAARLTVEASALVR